MNNKTYINGQDKKILRKLIQKELKVVRTLLDIDATLYGIYRSSLYYGLIKRGECLNELLTKLQ